MSEMWQWMGFDSINGRLMAGRDPDDRKGYVDPGAFVYVVNRPQVLWRGKRLFVSDWCSRSFLIHSIRAGVRETTVAYGPIPADAFSIKLGMMTEADLIFQKEGCYEIKIGESGEQILGAEWDLPLCEPGTEITIAIENISPVRSRFIAGFLGVCPSETGE